MKVSIIIPTFNRYSQLNRTLFSLIELKTPRNLFEIIVVDNGSTDKTKEIVEQYQTQHKDVQLRYFYDDIPGLLTGRHRGAKESKGEILTFIDDDVHVSALWLDTIIDVMSNRKDVSLLTGPNLPLYETYPPDWLNEFWYTTPYGGKMCDSLSLLDIKQHEIEIDPNYVWGLNFTIRKDVFTELKGFQPDNMPPHLQMFQGGGETGLTENAKRLRKKALYHAGVLVYHEVPASRLTFEYFDKRAYYLGLFLSYVELRNKKYNDQINTLHKEKKYSIIKMYKSVSEIIAKLLNTLSKKSNIKLRYELKTKQGYDFHQKMFKENETIRDWVYKEDYFDYTLPQL